MKKLHEWLGRPIVNPKDAEELETHAAINEFMHKMPKDHAEAQAYKHYSNNLRMEAANHHLSGLKDAQVAGDMESAKKHHAMYSLHAKALGHNPEGPVPEEITNWSKQKADKDSQSYKFKGHKADTLIVHQYEDPHASMNFDQQKGVFSSAPAPKVESGADKKDKK